ncbi:uncharacterized protein LOC128880015 isoform X1 [Hylaeus volcanicus]|uniref:uncharacterized protein LOC128880015 isoform X1 n=1 Tax=Hylaeus volcanicus TaxID=313075 RepID=UPI0023B86CBA|nr:uncharacterized protein LOC128880015 isoform X1 [Hylaeus volcanicus]XP_053985603.1 uncharacterized protein LOC128880015 isoform X1 [Hylaeus volcanicus]
MKPIGARNWYHWTLVFVILIIHVRAKKEKRQIFREQVLPALGGKIPEEAFKTDRLALNRLNKEGITVPDGVVLDARHVHKHSQHVQTMPEVIKVYLTPDGRYVPPEGRFHYNHAKTIDTTYVIRAPYSRSNGHKHSSNFNRNKHPELPKLQAYTSFRQFTPIVVPTKPGIYKPIVTPLVLPSGAELLEETYLPSWNVHYDWDTVYEPNSDYYISNIALFDSHQIITDYQGFLNNVHERSSRHIGSPYRDQNGFSRITKQESRGNGMKPRATSYQNVRLHLDKTVPRYTNLTSIPETSFACNGRRGMLADPETNCQVFHNCSGWSRTSSLCPGGTAFSEVKKRCEWWNTVQCK